MDSNHFILLAIIGLLGGLLGGMLGIGGAIIIIPGLVMAMGFSQQMAQGTTLMMMVLPVGAMAALQYYQKGYVDLKTALILGVFFFVGGYLGANFATHIPQHLLKKSFALLLVAIAIKMYFFDK